MFSKPATTLRDYSSISTATLRKWMDNMSTFIGNSIPAAVANSQVTAPQKTLTGSINPNTYRAYSDMDYMTAHPMNIQIHRATNGFIVRCGMSEGASYSVHIAKTIEEVNEIITTELVVKKMEGK
jgi:hypothetical protein